MADNRGRILVVDDNRLNRMKLARGLENQDHHVVLAENGLEALALLQEQVCDLILLDILMPEMDGYQVLERLKIHPTLREIPVIVISAIHEMDSIIKCIEMGAEDYLPKPFDAVLLRARIGAALEKKQLRDKERLYAKSLERDLEIGRQIQSSFFPGSLPQIDGWEIAAHFKAALQVSGDFYDAFTLADGSGMGFVVADVCNKGVGAALFMAIFRSLIRAFSGLQYGTGLAECLHERDAHASQAQAAQKETDGNHLRALRMIITHINEYIARIHDDANMFATLFWGIIDFANKTLSFINCGHETAVVVGPEGIKRILGPTGPAVGMFPDMIFEAKCIGIDPGDLVVSYTDGITEARSTDGGFYGEEKLMKLFSIQDQSADRMLDRITASLADHTEGAEQSDDITLMVIRRC